MATEHTPGPWSVEIEDHKAPDDWYAAAIGVGSAWAGTYRTLARVPQGEPGWDPDVQARNAADARLIAAAPDLLAALVAALEQTEDGLHPSQCNVNDCWVRQAQVAIAKARGEASGG